LGGFAVIQRCVLSRGSGGIHGWDKENDGNFYMYSACLKDMLDIALPALSE